MKVVRSYRKSLVHWLRCRLKDFLDVLVNIQNSTSIHGFRFIGDKSKHWSERLFWLLCVIVSWYCSSLLIAAQYDAYVNNPISFVVETTYKDWDTHFPSVAVCENDNQDRIEFASDTLWTPDHDFNLEEVLKELAYFKGITYYTSQFCAMDNPLEQCPKNNLTYYAELVRSSCQDTISNCSWNGEPFDCCEYFLPMDTELGTCYAINSIQGRDPNPKMLPMVSNKSTVLGSITMHVLVPANVYVLNEEEVPTLTTLVSDVISVAAEVSHRRSIIIRNIENDAAARRISPARRKCRYTDENILDVYRYYSYSACTVQCRKRAQLDMCNCTNFLMPNVTEEEKCDVFGLNCLNENQGQLSVLRASWSQRPGLFCDCLPSCTEADITAVEDVRSVIPDPYAIVKISLSVLPSERFRRNVVRGTLDLVVSMGGTTGLFLGASILSFVELLYYIIVRPSCDHYIKKNQPGQDYWYEKFKGKTLEARTRLMLKWNIAGTVPQTRRGQSGVFKRRVKKIQYFSEKYFHTRREKRV